MGRFWGLVERLCAILDRVGRMPRVESYQIQL